MPGIVGKGAERPRVEDKGSPSTGMDGDGGEGPEGNPELRRGKAAKETIGVQRSGWEWRQRGRAGRDVRSRQGVERTGGNGSGSESGASIGSDRRRTIGQDAGGKFGLGIRRDGRAAKEREGTQSSGVDWRQRIVRKVLEGHRLGSDGVAAKGRSARRGADRKRVGWTGGSGKGIGVTESSGWLVTGLESRQSEGIRRRGTGGAGRDWRHRTGMDSHGAEGKHRDRNGTAAW